MAHIQKIAQPDKKLHWIQWLFNTIFDAIQNIRRKQNWLCNSILG